MKLLIDDAHIDLIRKIYEFYPIDGVTSNPTILSKTGRNPYEVLKEIRSFIGEDADMHIQALGSDAETMVKEAEYINEQIGGKIYVKIPAVPEGFKAMKMLKKKGILFTATAIYTPMQALLAGKCGASYAAPYVNRIDNMGFDGIRVTKEIQDIFTKNNMDTQLLAASFKNSQQVLELAEYGIGAATVAPDVIEGFVKNAAVTSAVDAFVKDFEGLCGEGKNMLNI